MMNSHMPNFLEPIAKGLRPPAHGEEIASDFTSCTVHRPRKRSRNRKTHKPSRKCQYVAATSTAVDCVVRERFQERNATYSKAMMPPNKCTPCAAVSR